jgi:hypothetical protein
MTQNEFEALISDDSKRIEGSISWSDDEDHSPTVEFRVDVISDAGYPIFIRGSYNALASTLTYALIHHGVGRIYALDLGKDHHNPDCHYTGENHRHRWRESVRDKHAEPIEIAALVIDPLSVWQQFCSEARIQHIGQLSPPPEHKELI